MNRKFNEVKQIALTAIEDLMEELNDINYNLENAEDMDDYSSVIDDISNQSGVLQSLVDQFNKSDDSDEPTECAGTVEQTVSSGYDYKTITMPCGSTDIHGGVLQCDYCAKAKPTHCKHGKEIYPEDGRDIPCAACEMGE